jgi:hypothetical protein
LRDFGFAALLGLRAFAFDVVLDFEGLDCFGLFLVCAIVLS